MLRRCGEKPRDETDGQRLFPAWLVNLGVHMPITSHVFIELQLLQRRAMLLLGADWLRGMEALWLRYAGDGHAPAMPSQCCLARPAGVGGHAAADPPLACLPDEFCIVRCRPP